MRNKKVIKVSLVEVDPSGNEVELESELLYDHISQATIDAAINQRCKSSGLSKVTFTNLLAHWAIGNYLTHYTK